MIHIENLNMTIHTVSMAHDDAEMDSNTDIRMDLVDTLRIISQDPKLKNEILTIPEDCEQYGFAKGSFKLSEVLYFLADMLE